MKPSVSPCNLPLHFNYYPNKLKNECSGIQIQIIKLHQVEFIVMYKVSKNNLRQSSKAPQAHNSY